MTLPINRKALAAAMASWRHRRRLNAEVRRARETVDATPDVGPCDRHCGNTGRLHTHHGQLLCAACVRGVLAVEQADAQARQQAPRPGEET